MLIFLTLFVMEFSTKEVNTGVLFACCLYLIYHLRERLRQGFSCMIIIVLS